ncbi:MAG: erythromycin esterase-like enzyme [Verrucomicrobiales bacterium]|nr:erythromycin esterase-like enzyme [Verrucomicrobiales bacterium]
MQEKRIVSNLQTNAQQLDYEKILESIGDSRFVLIGEASHGTHEFYKTRADLTKLLIEKKGFNAVAIEADWPDTHRVHRYLTGDVSTDGSAEDALGNFKRFPTWMWRNTDVVAFLQWLKSWNDKQRPGPSRVGFYGLDLYSLYGSISAVIDYLHEVDPVAEKKARQAYSCFDHFAEDSQQYGFAAASGIMESCQKVVVRQLRDLQQREGQYSLRDGEQEGFFFAEQNAHLIKNAEEYYRSMFNGRTSSWNLRDTHMSETLEALLKYLSRFRSEPKVAIWAHNSHLGDARATQMGERGELNLGQLVRQQHPDESFLLGFTTYTGTVTAASEWGLPAQQKRVRTGMKGSFEHLFHEVGKESFFLDFHRDDNVASALRDARLERAIGVIYLPETEFYSHYFNARLAKQFDAVIHIDRTTALTPLDKTLEWDSIEPPESFPSGL